VPSAVCTPQSCRNFAAPGESSGANSRLSQSIAAGMQAQWQLYLRDGFPDEAQRLRANLVSRSEKLAASWLERDAASSSATRFPAVIDVVVAGSGFHVLLWLGVHTVLSRLEAAGRVRIQRYAGASSGAQAPAQWLVLGEEACIDLHLAFGMLWDAHVPHASMLKAGPHLRKAWPAMFDWMVSDHAAQLSNLDGRMYVSVSYIKWAGLGAMVQAMVGHAGMYNTVHSSFTGMDAENRRKAREVLYATGTLLTRVDGRLASDGGLTNNVPTFSDGGPAQLVVAPQKAQPKLPSRMIMSYGLAEAVAAMERGQDECIAFLEATLSPSAATSAPSTSTDCDVLSTKHARKLDAFLALVAPVVNNV
jgi:hypothetical protein